MQNKKRKAGKAIAYSNCQRKMEMHISSARWINEMKVNVRIHSRTHIRACPLFHIFFFAFSHFIWLPVCRVMSLMIFAFIGLMIIAWLLLVWEHMCAFYCTVNAKFSPNPWTRTHTHTHTHVNVESQQTNHCRNLCHQIGVGQLIAGCWQIFTVIKAALKYFFDEVKVWF